MNFELALLQAATMAAAAKPDALLWSGPAGLAMASRIDQLVEHLSELVGLAAQIDATQALAGMWSSASLLQ